MTGGNVTNDFLDNLANHQYQKMIDKITPETYEKMNEEFEEEGLAFRIIVPTQEQIDEIKPTLEELPNQKLDRYINDFKIEKNISKIIISEKDNTKVFEKMISMSDVSPKIIASWLVGDIFAYVKENNYDVLDLLDKVQLITDLLKLVSDDVISNKAGKEILPKVLSGEGSPNDLVKEMGLEQVSDTSELEKIIDDALEGDGENIAKFQAGSDRVLGYFVGKCLKASKGKGNPKLINKILQEKLQK